MFWGATLVKVLPKFLVPFATAGNITYSYYLFHGLVLLAVYWMGEKWWGMFELDNGRLFAFAVSAAALASLASLLIYRVAELPYFLRRSQ
jgi:peptidoglycan/LPS O-acetylase OafA/YrhL